jgi:hypothetical protein
VQHAVAEGSPKRAWFASPSPEDTILQKLDWHKKGQQISERQWGDVLGVLKVRAGELDLDYMGEWAATVGVAELLERALSEAAP